MGKDKKDKEDKDTRQKRSKGEVVTRRSMSVIMGDILSSSFFGKYKFTIILGVLLVMGYIAYKFECQTHMETITRLERELSKAQSESIRERSTYMSRIRESMMSQMIDSLHLDLRVQDQPPYTISYE